MVLLNLYFFLVQRFFCGNVAKVFSFFHLCGGHIPSSSVDEILCHLCNLGGICVVGSIVV